MYDQNEVDEDEDMEDASSSAGVAEDDTVPTIDDSLNAEQLKDIGNEKYKNKLYKQAVLYYTKAIEKSEKKVPAYFGNRAASYMMLLKWNEALEDCLESTRIDPKFVKGYLRAGKCYTQLGRLREARDQLQNTLLMEPHNKEAVEEMKTLQRVEEAIKAGDQEYENKQYHKALAHYDIANSFCSESIPVKVLKARALIGMKRYPETINYIGEILKTDPNNSEALYLRGLALLYTGNIPSATKHFRNCLSLDPDNQNYKAQFRKANSLDSKKAEGNEAFSSGDYQKAYDTYSECLSIDPNIASYNSVLYSNRAAALMKLKRYEEAIRDSTRTLDIDPTYIKAYLRRAQCYMLLDKFDEALRDYEAAQKRDPENEDIARGIKEAKVAMKRAKRKDFYKILGVMRNADENEIKSAYKKLALRWHPDKNSGSEEDKKKAEAMFKDIGEAYSVLSDPKKRRRYDMGEDLDEEGGGGPSDEQLHQMFSMFFGGGGGGGGFHGGGGGHGQRRGRPPGYPF